jgi:hypothetical protein
MTFFRTEPFAIAQIDVPVFDLAARLGAPVEEWDEDGLGPVRAIGIRLRDGRPISFHQQLLSPDGYTDIYADAGDVASVGAAEMLDLVIAECEIPGEAIRWRQTASREAAAERARRAEEYRATYLVWAVKRLDDNGNTFVVAEGLRRRDAEELAAEYMAKGHKQLYWVEHGSTGATM